MFMPILPGLECFLLYLLLATRLHLIFGTHSLNPTASFITDLDATVTGGSGCAIISYLDFAVFSFWSTREIRIEVDEVVPC